MTDLNDVAKSSVSRRRALAGSLSTAATVTLSNTAVPENAGAVPVKHSAKKLARLLKGAKESTTRARRTASRQVNADLLACIKA
jgi:hypothetical protein